MGALLAALAVDTGARYTRLNAEALIQCQVVSQPDEAIDEDAETQSRLCHLQGDLGPKVATDDADKPRDGCFRSLSGSTGLQPLMVRRPNDQNVSMAAIVTGTSAIGCGPVWAVMPARVDTNSSPDWHCRLTQSQQHVNEMAPIGRTVTTDGCQALTLIPD